MNLFCKAYPRHSIKYSISYIEYLGIESCFLVVVSKIFYFHPYLGKIPSLTNILFFKWIETTNQLFIFDRSWVISFVNLQVPFGRAWHWKPLAPGEGTALIF